jgi:TPR repeat protein
MMFMATTSYLAAEWNQSLLNNEEDCDLGNASGCSIAGSMYENGNNVTWDGLHNIESSMKKDTHKALKFYKKGCKLGDSTSCDNLKELSKKLGLKADLSPSSSAQENYRVYNHNGNKVYEMGVKNPCHLTVDKNGKIVKNSCKKLINSKGVTIYCNPSKKVCKTENEIMQSIAK